LSPVGLGELLRGLPANEDPNLLVGFDTSDDAAVYRLNGEQAFISTADIITPPVDDPYLFGQIAAANSLSDVYAMGGRPVTCLNLVAFTSDKLGPEVLHQMIAGALSKVTEAGAVLAGGHTTEDEEPKYGLAVTGLVHPDEIWTNVGSRPGDALVLTKPIGSGVIFNANLKGWISEGALAACIETITTLNRTAAEVLRNFDVHAATDVTGFGLAGHAFEMAQGPPEVTMRIEIDAVPLMDEALDAYHRGMSTGVNRVNRELVASSVRFDRELPGWHEEIFVDPQTSGGLLAAVPAEEAEDVVAALREAGVSSADRIGTVEAHDGRSHLVFV
jgi:selenide,water dikinase